MKERFLITYNTEICPLAMILCTDSPFLLASPYAYKDDEEWENALKGLANETDKGVAIPGYKMILRPHLTLTGLPIAKGKMNDLLREMAQEYLERVLLPKQGKYRRFQNDR